MREVININFFLIMKNRRNSENRTSYSSVANKIFSVDRSKIWGSKGYFEAPVGPAELHISTPRSTENGEN